MKSLCWCLFLQWFAFALHFLWKMFGKSSEVPLNDPDLFSWGFGPALRQIGWPVHNHRTVHPPPCEILGASKVNFHPCIWVRTKVSLKFCLLCCNIYFMKSDSEYTVVCIVTLLGWWTPWRRNSFVYWPFILLVCTCVSSWLFILLGCTYLCFKLTLRLTCMHFLVFQVYLLAL